MRNLFFLAKRHLLTEYAEPLCLARHVRIFQLFTYYLCCLHLFKRKIDVKKEAKKKKNPSEIPPTVKFNKSVLQTVEYIVSDEKDMFLL